MFHNLHELASNAGDITFGAPLWLALIAALVILLPLRKRLRPAVAATYGNRSGIKSVGSPGMLCTTLFIGLWCCFCVVMSHPQLTESGFTPTYQAREFQILIDDSGSMFSWDVKDEQIAKVVMAWEKKVYDMQRQLFKEHPELFTSPPKMPDEQPEWTKQSNQGQLTRFALARYASYQFVMSRLTLSQKAKEVARKEGKAVQGDRVGIAPFDDTVHGGVPITGNLDEVLREIIDLMNAIKPGGTNFDGPNPESGELRVGAFQYAINQFNNPKLSRQGIKTKVMIFISDGDAGIAENRHAALAQAMKERKEGDAPIHVFFFVCGPKEQVGNAATASAKKLIKEVNPPDWKEDDYIFWAGNGKAIQHAFDTINKLEASTIEGEPFSRKRDVSYEFMFAGAMLGALWLITTAVFREGF